MKEDKKYDEAVKELKLLIDYNWTIKSKYTAEKLEEVEQALEVLKQGKPAGDLIEEFGKLIIKWTGESEIKYSFADRCFYIRPYCSNIKYKGKTLAETIKQAKGGK